ncbi:uncharacterized protein B0P05DRAFT_603841 [Gilbertella persicaria]|uniref:uncharacterized protein n=1 Tax=Gilbertella persicaria TaxID=101096 RepID=UPI00221E52FB|nr:uncharacterized protein B0P05DRAFT_603841 [Gilbertella persicaria]KAI8079568.1 hypothetical protein B0P05DRAFT_603841 [Gilbertella persicaria]
METTVQVYEAFNTYPWSSDKLFQSGLSSILSQVPQTESSQDKLLKAKHFYFSKFYQNFELEGYLEYEAEKNRKEREASFKRLEDYDYENDIAYTSGLPNIIHHWLEEQSKGLWNKERLDKEFMKAKAFYYHSQIEKVDLAAYFAWKTSQEEENKPACPFANLWQNKVKVGPVDQLNGSSFIMSEKPKGTGAQIMTISSPKSQNVFTIDRLHELDASLEDGISHPQVTSLFITTTVADKSLPISMDQPIGTIDTKMTSKGLAYEETSALVSGSELRETSLYRLAKTYYRFVESSLNADPKLTVTYSNGQIPLNAVYIPLNFRYMRVITEHALLNFQLTVSHAPIPPLLLFAMARARTKQSLPAGFELYLALAVPEYAKLRGPELLRLGLVDVFIPEAKLSDAIDTAKKMALCPAPDTNAAIQLALAMYHSYAGPDRFSVWEKSIETVFGAAESLEDLKERLSQLGNTWSKNILSHWKTLPPVLLHVVFKAVKKSMNKTPMEILSLEAKLNAKWRQSVDYKTWLRKQTSWIQENIDEHVSYYFEELKLPKSEESVVYKAPQVEDNDNDTPMVCPVTGQKASSANACPISMSKESQGNTDTIEGSNE